MLVSKAHPMNVPPVKFKAKFPTTDVIRVVTGQIERGSEEKVAKIVAAHCYLPDSKAAVTEVMSLFINKFAFIQKSFAEQHPELSKVIKKAADFFSKPVNNDSTEKWIANEAAHIGDTFEVRYKGISKDDFTSLIRS